MDKLIKDIEDWACDKGIMDGSDSNSQFIKTVAELGELADALSEKNRPEIIDGIGDVFVTLVILAKLEGLNIKSCVAAAYSEIAERKGEMVNGFFVKEST